MNISIKIIVDKIDEIIAEQMGIYFPDFKSHDVIFRNRVFKNGSFTRRIADNPHLQQELFFQTNRAGQRTEVIYSTCYHGLIKNKKRHCYGLETKNFTQSLPWETRDDILPWFEEYHRKLRIRIDHTFQKSVTEYEKLTQFYDHLLEQYTQWFQQSGHQLSPTDLQQMYTKKNDSVGIIGHDHFLHFLKKTGFLEKVPKGFDPIYIWHFWVFGRPLQKDSLLPTELYDCRICEEAYSLKKLHIKNKRDPIFGSNVEFECQRCIEKSVL